MKNNLKLFKEAWKHPFYSSLIKLGCYALFFAVFFIIIALGRNNPIIDQEENNDNISSYKEMKNNIIENNLKIKYHILAINEYYLEGTIINDIFSGTLEQDDIIKKLKITKENIFLIEKNTETLTTELLKDINIIYIFPANIINILKENDSIIKQNDLSKTYSYKIDNKAITVFIEDNKINKIIILDNSITYELEIEII